MFSDRREAGRRLAAALRRLALVEPIVLALPRGGVPVGYEIALALNAPLGVLMVRKIGAPGHEELAVAAVVDGQRPTIVRNEAVARSLADAEGYIQAEAARQLQVIAQRRRRYGAACAPLSPSRKCVIVVDDGIATGATAEAALQGLKQAKPRQVVVAAPVAPREAVARLEGLADRVVCLATPEPFCAVGLHYESFEQTGDEEVVALLADAGARSRGAPAGSSTPGE